MAVSMIKTVPAARRIVLCQSSAETLETFAPAECEWLSHVAVS